MQKLQIMQKQQCVHRKNFQSSKQCFQFDDMLASERLLFGSPKNQSNTTYSEELSEYAEGVASSCTMSMFTTYGIAYSVHKEMPTVDDVVRAFYNEGKYYDRYTGSCSIANGCVNFKQFAWFEANALGCGLSKCEHLNHGSESGYFAVCAYSTKARASGYPFAPALDCLTCPTEKPLCSRKYHCCTTTVRFQLCDPSRIGECFVGADLCNDRSVAKA
ncbi:hypothetical protein Tsp_10331 [Trichinella spiralis]|uniref:hypothetical protein n=1 Tax=Trichinella spiralis TaxID=6334 RepID=UPI0001EFE37C|nr:hypothetical protein Tsp_10331 [Trichinella spiralis]